MAEKISMRLQTPPDENGERKDIHPITTTDEVIVNVSGKDPITLSDKLDQVSTIQIQESQPTFPCIWAKPVNK